MRYQNKRGQATSNKVYDAIEYMLIHNHLTPSNPDIAEVACCCQSTVDKHIKLLEQAGRLKIGTSPRFVLTPKGNL